MAISETIRWGKDAAGNPVIEVVRVEQLDVDRARRLLTVISRTLTLAVKDVDALATKRVQLSELLADLPAPLPPAAKGG